MNLDYYKNFIAIVESGGVGKAARSLHLAQPALSHQLRVMEREFGAPLLEKRPGKRTLSLTSAGWVLYRQAKRMADLDFSLHEEIESISRGVSGTLRISSSPASTGLLIDRCLLPFSALYPDVRYHLREPYHIPLLADVTQGISEIGIANAPLPDMTLFDILGRRTASLRVVSWAGDPLLSETSALSARDLATVPLAVSQSTEALVHKSFRQLGLAPMLAASVDSRSAALHLTAHRLARNITVWEDTEPLPEGFISVPFKGLYASVEKTLFCLKGHELSPVMKKFIEFIAKTADVSIKIPSR